MKETLLNYQKTFEEKDKEIKELKKQNFELTEKIKKIEQLLEKNIDLFIKNAELKNNILKEGIAWKK